MWAIARCASALAFLATLALGFSVSAEPAQESPESLAAPKLQAFGLERAEFGKPIVRIEVASSDREWFVDTQVRYVSVGENLTPEVARRALREVLATGLYAGAEAEADLVPGGVVLRIRVVPRRIVANVRLRGPVLDSDEIKQAAEVQVGDEIVFSDTERMRLRVRDYYDRRGFPGADVAVEALATDDPLRVSLVISVVAGNVRRAKTRIFLVEPRSAMSEVNELLNDYSVNLGDRLDARLLDEADARLTKNLIERGWHGAKVSHRVNRGAGALSVSVLLGRRVLIEFEGNRSYDAAQLLVALELEEREDRQPENLRQRLADFYVRRGFWDANVEVFAENRGSSIATAYRFRIIEGQPLRVLGRKFPCLTGERTAADLDAEINSFLIEGLPGPELYAGVDAATLDGLLGPTAGTGARPSPYLPNPVQSYVPEVYERALKHVQGLYRSEGYLSASVGPIQLLRRRCAPGSTPTRCLPLGSSSPPRATCSLDDRGLPLEEIAPALAAACQVNSRTGSLCESGVSLSIPVKLGPLTRVYDVAFEGNRRLTEAELLEAAEIDVGEPASQVLLDAARQRLSDLYAEEGYAFADIDPMLELSIDHTRASLRFSIMEREQVRVARIVVKGARLTNESLIRRRIALKEGDLYRRSWVRQTEERLATLGVFSSIRVGFEDPDVYAREKVVVVEVQERTPQYLEPRLGFSTGEGFRGGFEYGHKNLLGEAVQLTLRIQLNYLPDSLILEPDVRRKRPAGIGNQLERNSSALVVLPEVGLGPLIGFSVEGIDLRDNARDYGLLKDAVIATLGYRPSVRVSVQLGGAIEFNNASIFFDGNEAAEKQRLRDFIRDNPSQRDRFRVPEGKTRAIAERVGFSWDRRDTPLDASTGTLTSVDVEHVTVTPIRERTLTLAPATPMAALAAGPDPFSPSRGDFFRVTQRTAGYLRLNKSGLALAMSLGWGVVIHTNADSQTYPDRLFFMGGVDSIRGFLQDSVVPEDVARRVVSTTGQASAGQLTLREVVIRGGDIFLNPRTELRIPLSNNLKTAVFLDAGNVWTAPAEVLRAPRLRYAVGTGLRIATPIGPLVFDYGLNLEQVLASVLPGHEDRRPWEDLGAFHFSIGVF